MNKKKFSMSLAALLLIVLGVSGYFAIAAEYGSKQDPLVTLSYINDVLAPGTIDEINKLIESKKTEFDTSVKTKLDEFNAAVDAKLAQSSGAASYEIDDALIDAVADKVVAKMLETGSGVTSAASTWQVIKVPAGKTLTGQVGCEIILRIGKATCVAGGSPGLINLSDATDLPNGSGLVTNNLYIVTINGRAITSSGGCTVLVNGSYTIG